MSLQDMIRRTAQHGRVVWIGLRPDRLAPMESVESVFCAADGLAGDHSRAGKRAVTMIQSEHLPAIASYLGRASVLPKDLRRNLVIEGINLASLKGRQVQIGAAVLEFTVICAPCSRMEAAFGDGGYAAVRGHGGWCARVVSPGGISVGDSVFPRDP